MEERPFSSPVARAVETFLLIVWVAAAALTMYPEFAPPGVRGTWFTSYGADVANPAWLYMVFRRRRPRTVHPLLLRTPWITAAAIATTGALSEALQAAGLIAGVADPLDIAAYSAAVAVCCLWEIGTARGRQLPAPS